MLVGKDYTHSSIKNFVKLSGSTVSWHLNKLVDKNVIAKVQSGKTVRYKLTLDREKIVKLIGSLSTKFQKLKVENMFMLNH